MQFENAMKIIESENGIGIKKRNEKLDLKLDMKLNDLEKGM